LDQVSLFFIFLLLSFLLCSRYLLTPSPSASQADCFSNVIQKQYARLANWQIIGQSVCLANDLPLGPSPSFLDPPKKLMQAIISLSPQLICVNCCKDKLLAYPLESTGALFLLPSAG
jgi:hypothetical protein